VEIGFSANTTSLMVAMPRPVSVAATTMDFEVGSSGKSLTVTLADTSSGEVIRALVYDRSARVQSVTGAGRGHLIDTAQ
jgi:hypothetical protein